MFPNPRPFDQDAAACVDDVRGCRQPIPNARRRPVGVRLRRLARLRRRSRRPRHFARSIAPRAAGRPRRRRRPRRSRRPPPRATGIAAAGGSSLLTRRHRTTFGGHHGESTDHRADVRRAPTHAPPKLGQRRRADGSCLSTHRPSTRRCTESPDRAAGASSAVAAPTTASPRPGHQPESGARVAGRSVREPTPRMSATARTSG